MNEGGGETERVDGIEEREKKRERRGLKHVEENRLDDLMVNKPVQKQLILSFPISVKS